MMTQEKKKLRFTAIDCFVLILCLVVAVAFFAKGYLASLIQSEKELVKITYTLSFDTPPEGLEVGDKLSTQSGRDLGTVLSLRGGEGELLYCEVEGYAGKEGDSFVISADTVLKKGITLSVFCGEKEFVANIVEILPN